MKRTGFRQSVQFVCSCFRMTNALSNSVCRCSVASSKSSPSDRPSPKSMLLASSSADSTVRASLTEISYVSSLVDLVRECARFLVDTLGSERLLYFSIKTMIAIVNVPPSSTANASTKRGLSKSMYSIFQLILLNSEIQKTSI